MIDKFSEITSILSTASETHHTVFKILEGNDPDWASWYSDWLLNLSALPKLLGSKPVRSELIYMLVKLDKDFNSEKPKEKWEEYYAKRLLAHFI